MDRPPDDVMSMEQLAEYLKVSRHTLYKLAREGKMPGQKIGKRWRFLRAAIDDWLSQQHQDGDGKVRPGDRQ